MVGDQLNGNFLGKWKVAEKTPNGPSTLREGPEILIERKFESVSEGCETNPTHDKGFRNA